MCISLNQGNRNNFKINNFRPTKVSKNQVVRKLNRVHSIKVTLSQGSPTTQPWPSVSFEENGWKGYRSGRTFIQWNIDLMKHLAFCYLDPMKNWFNETVYYLELPWLVKPWLDETSLLFLLLYYTLFFVIVSIRFHL